MNIPLPGHCPSLLVFWKPAVHVSGSNQGTLVKFGNVHHCWGDKDKAPHNSVALRQIYRNIVISLLEGENGMRWTLCSPSLEEAAVQTGRRGKRSVDFPVKIQCSHSIAFNRITQISNWEPVTTNASYSPFYLFPWLWITPRGPFINLAVQTVLCHRATVQVWAFLSVLRKKAVGDHMVTPPPITGYALQYV